MVDESISHMANDMAQSLLDTMSAHICVLDETGKLLHANEAWKQFARPNGLSSPNYAIGENYLSVCGHATDPDTEQAREAADGIRRVLAGDLGEFKMEYPCHCADALRWFVMSVTRFETLDGPRAVVAHTDITASKLAEIELTNTSTKLRLIMDTIQDGVWLIHLPERHDYFTPRMYTMLGYDPPTPPESEDLFWKIVHPADKPRVESTFAALCQGIVPEISLECRFRDSDGEWRWVWSRGRVVERGEDGKPSLIAGSHTDVTLRKQLEHRLTQGEKLEALGTLSGGIAHEFNNILAAIIGYSELAMESVDDNPTLHRDLDRVLSAANRAKELVQQILAFSRDVEQERHPIFLQPLLRESLRIMQSSLPENITLSSSICVDCGPVLAEPTQIQQVIENLFANAVHAMGAKKGTLKIDLLEDPADPKGRLCIRVSDTGCGIPDGIRDRIFEPFFSTREVGKGTGLGLATVHGIVKSHGGVIQVESKEGEGSRFDVYLPTAKTADNSVVPRVVQAEDSGKRIMLVDDEVLLCNLLAGRLTKFGFNVMQFSESREALRHLTDNPDDFDLLLTDQQMPHLTGLELTNHAHALRPDLPVVLMTGFSESVSAANCREFGIFGYVEKPFSVEKLAETIREALRV